MNTVTKSSRLEGFTDRLSNTLTPIAEKMQSMMFIMRIEQKHADFTANHNPGFVCMSVCLR